MTAPRVRVVVVIALVVLAGCSFTLDTGETATPTPGVEQETPSATPTPNETSPYPPGVNETHLENTSALLSSHTAVLNQTGYVANGSGNTTIRHSGLLINASRSVRVVVANGSQRYFEVRRSQAGPVDRLVQRYSNGSEEFIRFAENGDVEFRQRAPQSPEKLAHVGHLESFLLGGNFTVAEVREDDEPTTVVLRANRSDNETALLSGLPEDAERIRSYSATVVVDSDGRVRWLDADVGFVIGGANRNHTVTFNLTRIGVSNVSEPDWLDEMDESEGSADDQSGESDDRRSDHTDSRRGPFDRGGALVGPPAHLEQHHRPLRRADRPNRHLAHAGPGSHRRPR